MVKQWKGFLKSWFLYTELVRKGIRLKYRRSYLGILWSLVEPILTTCVLVIVFGTLFNNRAQDYPVYIISGRLLFSFFSQTTKQTCKSIRKNATMIKKVYVPKYMYPLADVTFHFIIFAISLIALIPVMIFCREMPTVYIWQIFPAMLCIFGTTLGISMFLSTVNVFFRDIEYLWNVISMLIMYMCAIFYYPDRLLDSGYAWVLKLNPVYCAIDIFRGGMMGYMASGWNYIYAAGFSVVAVVVGTLFFKMNQDKFIMHI